MSDELFVPQEFAVPDGLTAREFRLAPLGPQQELFASLAARRRHELQAVLRLHRLDGRATSG
jgi:hypothetical protein